MAVAVEKGSRTLELTPTDRERFQSLRRTILDTQIMPAIATKLSWLGYSEPPKRGAEMPTNLDMAAEVTPILSRLGNKLDEVVTRAEKDSTFGSYYLRLYETPFGMFQPAAPDFHYLTRSSFDRAATDLLTTIQGEVPLRVDYSWDEIAVVYQEMGKHMPPLPKELIYVGGQDGGVINGRIGVTLPTKAPFMFIDYTFRLWGRSEGSNQHDNPVKPKPLPTSVAIQVVTLDQYYPYPGQRSLRSPGS